MTRGRLQRIMLIATLLAVPLVLLVLPVLGGVNSTITVTVESYVSATGLDTSSSVTLNPASAPTYQYSGWDYWIASNPNDDIILNLTGTNTNVTAYLGSISFNKPSSYPTGMPDPVLGLSYQLDSSENTRVLSNIVDVLLENGNVTLDATNDYLAKQYQNSGKQLNNVDLPEGLLNYIYDKTFSETEWYQYTYNKIVTLPVLLIKYDPNTNQYVYQNTNIQLCMLIVDLDGSIQGSGISNDELIVIAPPTNGVCDYDSDGSNSTLSGSDLVSTGDFAATFTPSTSNHKALYDQDAIGWRTLVTDVRYNDNSITTLYAKPTLSYDNKANKIIVILKPVYPIPYSSLASIYGSNSKPYLHIWPTILVPVGAPAGGYTVTADIIVEQA